MTLQLTLTGQLPSGKNAVLITRTGHRYPGKRFKAWREDAYLQLIQQIGGKKRAMGLPWSHTPLTLRVTYCPGDLRTRDVSGLLDAVFSLLVHAGIIQDDGQIRHVLWEEGPMERGKARTVLLLEKR